MKRISVVFAVFPIISWGWDPLPSLSNQAIASGQAAFFNPAAGIGLDNVTTVAYSTEDIAPTWGRDRLWSLHYQGLGHAEGLRFEDLPGDFRMRVDLAFGRQLSRSFSGGFKLGYTASSAFRNTWNGDFGLLFRPCLFLQAGYRSENMLTNATGASIHHLALGLRPLAGFSGWPGDLTAGLATSYADGDRRGEFLFTKVPLPWGFQVQSQWDWRRKEASLGIVLQATSQLTAAWSRSKVSGSPGRREAALEFSGRQRAPSLLPTGNVAEVNLNISIVEGETPAGPFNSGREMGFVDLCRRLDALEADDQVKAVLVRLGEARCGWGMGEEIRERLLRLRRSGKRVTAYMEVVTPLNYYLATGANVIAMQPTGYFAIKGFAAEVTFYRGLFDKLGVEPQFLRHGKYKSYVEPYMRRDMSPEARADLAEFLQSLWDRYLRAVSLSRRIPVDSLRTALEQGGIGLDRALKARLIDTLIQQDQALELAGGKNATLKKNLPDGIARDRWRFPTRIALVVVNGEIVSGRSSKGFLGGSDKVGSQTVAAQLRKARLSPEIRAVILRVNSPGGSAQASDVIWREVELLKKAGKPVVASVGNMAASGGYYIVCGADRIIVAPNSAVGSIGVLWGKFVLRGLYEKLGLRSETVKTSRHADASSLARPWDSLEVAALQDHMDTFYGDFVSKVAAGRKKSWRGVDSLGQGRIFTGTQALRDGLADEMGGMEDAIQAARKLAHIDSHLETELVTVPAEGGNISLSLGMDWAKAPASPEESLRRLQESFLSMAQPQLWAIDPELAGWNTDRE